MSNILGMTDIAKLLGCSRSKVKYLWNGRQDKSGNTKAPQLIYHIAADGRRYSTRADINSYLKREYKITLNYYEQQVQI